MKHSCLHIFTLLVLAINASFGQKIDEQETKYFCLNESWSFNFEYAIGNFIKVSTGEDIKNFSGFLLGGVEIEKHLNKDKSFYAEVSAITDFPIPLPAPYDCEYCENGGAVGFAIGLKRTFRLNEESAISVALGPSTNFYYYNLTDEISDTVTFEGTNVRFTNWGYGLNGDLSYLRKIQFGNDYHIFGIGLNYSPTFINSRSLPHNYLHAINLKLIYKLSLNRRRRGG